eukprot:4194858-Pleurochrysis_carterae.AAC.1
MRCLSCARRTRVLLATALHAQPLVPARSCRPSNASSMPVCCCSCCCSCCCGRGGGDSDGGG